MVDIKSIGGDMKSDRKNAVWRAGELIAVLLIPFVLSSCITGSRQVPVDVEEQESGEAVSTVSYEREEGKKQSIERKRQRSKAAGKVAKKRRESAKKYGEITVSSVNIRAGANMNYEILSKLNKGDRVSIISEGFGWYEIELPPGCSGWIHSDYVSVKGTPMEGKKVTGTVTGNSVRIRAMPQLKCSVLSSANKGDRVVVIGSEGDWFKIKLPRDCTGWVSSDYVSLKVK